MPYEVTLVDNFNNSIICGGSIINTYLILTAARCLTNYVANFSGTELKVTAGKRGNQQSVNVSEIFIHEDYDPGLGLLLNDVAILVLSNGLVFNNYVDPARFPMHRDEVPDLATASGWGILTYGWTPGIVKRHRIPRSRNSTIPKSKALDNIRCTGNNALGDCQGYMGSGIYCTSKLDSHKVLCGINSFHFGPNIPETENSPNIYNEIIYHLSWIQAKSVCICGQDWSSIGRSCYPRSDIASCRKQSSNSGCSKSNGSKNLETAGSKEGQFWDVVKHTFNISYISGAPDGVATNNILGINGLFPAPTIRTKVGDIIRVRIINTIQDGQNTSLHWHGIQQAGTPWQDGPSMVTQCPLKVGSQQVYQFPVKHAGTYWYHSHVNSQYTEGLWGVLIIHDVKENFHYTAELIITLNEWYHHSATENEEWHLSRNSSGAPPYPNSALMNAVGRCNCSTARLDKRTCSETLQLRPVFHVSQSDVIRLRLMNIGGWATYNFSIDGHTLLAMEVDGIEIERASPSNALYLGVGQRYSLLLRRNPGNTANITEFTIRATVRTEYLFRYPNLPNINPYPDQFLNEIVGVLRYEPDRSLDPKWRRRVQVSKTIWVTEIRPTFEKFGYTSKIPRDPVAKNYLSVIRPTKSQRFPVPSQVDEEFTLNLTFITDNVTGIRRAAFNNQPFVLPYGKPLLVKALQDETLPATAPNVVISYGSVVQIVINNLYRGPHPVHLHGHHFWVVAAGKADDGITRSYAVIRFVADNPGVWAFHCHIDWHNLSGMRVVVVEGMELARKIFHIPEQTVDQCAEQGIVIRLSSGRTNKPKTPRPAGQLFVEHLDVKLPTPNSCPRPWYDGDDTIYLLGGCETGTETNILKFSISCETLELVASLPEGSDMGTVQADRFGNIFYFGGGPDYTSVIKFDPKTNTAKTVATLPYDVMTSASVTYKGTAVIMGGYDNDRALLLFNLETLNYSNSLTNLSFPVNKGALIKIGNKAFIFDATDSYKNRKHFELNLETFELSRVKSLMLPPHDGYSSVVTDGTYGYLIGGYDDPDIANLIVQFNPGTSKYKYFPIEYFPETTGRNYFTAPATVFVPGKNRIYYFGGESLQSVRQGYGVHDEIFYIDLSPVVPTATLSPVTEQTTTEVQEPVTTPSVPLLATYLDIKLPRPNSCHRLSYDGRDSIYLFAGCRWQTEMGTNIFKFSISSESLVKVGSLPDYGWRGTVQSDSHGNIFYLGGGSGGRAVYKFILTTNTSRTVATLPADVNSCTSFKYNNSVFMLGGDGQYGSGNKLLIFNMETLTSSTVSATLPFWVNGGTAVTIGKKAFVFSATETKENGQALEIDLETYSMTQVGPEAFQFMGSPSAVADGNWVYIIGGYRETDNESNGFFKFNGVTHENKFLPVTNVPRTGTDFNTAPAAVFVPSKNRIYAFGGQTVQGTVWQRSILERDEIFYVDLNPTGHTTILPPTTAESDTVTNPDSEEVISPPGPLLMKYLDVKLPFPNSCPKPWYDGKDSIYLFGWCDNPGRTNILKFSISSESLETVGHLPGRGWRGTVHSDRSENVFYLGGGFSWNEVYKFDPTTYSSSSVATLPYDVMSSTSVKYNDTVFILGGTTQFNTLLTVDMEALNYSTVSTNLSFSVYGAASVRVGSKAYIFDATGSQRNRQALELDLGTYAMRRVGPSTLSLFTGFSSAVWGDKFVYVIGASGDRYSPKDENVSIGIFQFNPNSFENKFIPVANLLPEGHEYFSAPGLVFVPGKNRIYAFGGESQRRTDYERKSRDEIFYIDVNAAGSIKTTEQTNSATLNFDSLNS